MPQYPIGGPTYTVQAYLKNPRVIARQLTNLTYNRFIADKMCLVGSPESVAGGSARYQRSEDIFLSRDAETTAIGTEFPRAGWSEDVLTAVVEQHGLEVPINGLAIRRNQIDQMQRALRKLANSVVSFVDGIAIATIEGDADILTDTGTAWSTEGAAIADIAEAKKVIREQNQGYEADTLIVHEDQNLDMLLDARLQAVQPRESNRNQIMSGDVIPFLGLRQILVTNQITPATAILMDSSMAMTIADEQPAPEEGYMAFSPGPEFRPIQTLVYKEDRTSNFIIRGVRWPAMWIAEPKAIFRLTTI